MWGGVFQGLDPELALHQDSLDSSHVFPEP